MEVVVEGPQVGAEVDEEADAVEVALGCGAVQGRVAVVVTLVRVTAVAAARGNVDVS